MSHDSSITAAAQVTPESEPCRLRLTVDGTNIVEISGDADFMSRVMQPASLMVGLLLQREAEKSGRPLADVGREFMDKLSKAVVEAVALSKAETR